MAFRLDVTTLGNTPITFSLPDVWAAEAEARTRAKQIGKVGAWNGEDYYSAHRIDNVTLVEV